MAQNNRRSTRPSSTDSDTGSLVSEKSKVFRTPRSMKLSQKQVLEVINLSDSDSESDTQSKKKTNGKIETSVISACNGSPIKANIIIKICRVKVEDKMNYVCNLDVSQNKKKSPVKNTTDFRNRSKSPIVSKTTDDESNIKNSRNLRSTRKPINYSEQSPKKATKRIKSVNFKSSKDGSEKSDENEIDENDMDNANEASPSKRKRIINPLSRTPSKHPSTPLTPSLHNQMSNMTIDTPKNRHRDQNNLLKNSAAKRLNLDDDGKVKKAKISSYNDFGLSEDMIDNDPSPDYCLEEDQLSSSSEEESSYDDDSDCIFNPKGQFNTPKKIPKTSKIGKVSIETPTKQIKRLNLNSLTPTVQKRISSIVKPTTPLQQARQKLHVSILPKSLPCRNEQFNDIYTFLHNRLSDKTGGCIYISGLPGTGKTATVTEVIRILKKEMTEGKLPKFEFVDINGMKLTEPRQAYTQICKHLTKENRTWEDAQKILQTRFSKADSKRGMTLLLVDELDLLCTKRQDVIYNLLDWPSKQNAKLIVVTIANTMDLPERVFMGKVTSRLGLTRLTFQPYDFKQLEEIVVSRLKDQKAFDNDTIQLVARKIASVSGDARRALDICRRSTEVAESNNRETVTLSDVNQALDEMIANPKIQAIKHCSSLEKYFLRAVCSESERKGTQEGVDFQNIYNHFKTLLAADGLKAPNVTQALSICARLGSYRLLITEHSRQDIHQRVMLNVPEDDVHYGTKEHQ